MKSKKKADKTWSDRYLECSPTTDAISINGKNIEDYCRGCMRPMSISYRGRECRNPACPAVGIRVR